MKTIGLQFACNCQFLDQNARQVFIGSCRKIRSCQVQISMPLLSLPLSYWSILSAYRRKKCFLNRDIWRVTRSFLNFIFMMYLTSFNRNICHLDYQVFPSFVMLCPQSDRVLQGFLPYGFSSSTLVSYIDNEYKSECSTLLSVKIQV